jgi:nucleoside-specific outer membrane channel protein Tsx
MFQKNIVANSKSPTSKYHKYLDWFELAEKTQNKLNQKADFLKYEEDSIFVELMRRISKEMLTPEDFSYIEDQEQYTERVKRYDKTIFKEGLEMGIRMTAEKMIAKGMDNATIAEITGLSEIEIQKIREETK